MALPGISEREIQTRRLRVHIREAGAGTPVVLIHGNCSSGAFYEDLMLAMPPGFRAIVPDLRGYGDTEPLPVDATRGCGEWADDLHALVEALDLDRFHLLGWSLGGGVVQRYAVEHPERLLSITFIAPMSPFGFGGTKDLQGTPVSDDFVCSGAGVVNPEFVKALGAKYTGHDGQAAPRNVMNAFYFKPPFKGSPEQEERWLASLVSTRTGVDFYPGDLVPSGNWPGTAPGTHGFANAMSPKYHNTWAFKDINPKPPVLWVRGDSDQIVSDASFFDVAFLGSVGAIPGWPGAEVAPPQPMVSQMRAMLDAYRANGGSYEELILPDAGHSPHLEKPDLFQAAFFKHISQ